MVLLSNYLYLSPCSDSFLELSLSGLENGIDFNDFLGEVLLELRTFVFKSLQFVLFFNSLQCGYFLALLKKLRIIFVADTNDSDSSTSANQCKQSKSHDRQAIEIEILLYCFSQPSAEVKT